MSIASVPIIKIHKEGPFQILSRGMCVANLIQCSNSMVIFLIWKYELFKKKLNAETATFLMTNELIIFF